LFSHILFLNFSQMFPLLIVDIIFLLKCDIIQGKYISVLFKISARLI
jgi:hypothetical protein